MNGGGGNGIGGGGTPGPVNWTINGFLSGLQFMQIGGGPGKQHPGEGGPKKSTVGWSRFWTKLTPSLFSTDSSPGQLGNDG